MCIRDSLTDKGFMGIFHTNPFLFRLADLFLVLIGDIGLLVVDAVANIGFIFQDAFDLRNRPGIGLFLRRTRVNVGEGAVPLVVQPTGGGHFFRDQNAGDLGCASAMNGQIEDFLYDPAGFFVRCQRDVYKRQVQRKKRNTIRLLKMTTPKDTPMFRMIVKREIKI